MPKYDIFSFTICPFQFIVNYNGTPKIGQRILDAAGRPTIYGLAVWPSVGVSAGLGTNPLVCGCAEVSRDMKDKWSPSSKWSPTMEQRALLICKISRDDASCISSLRKALLLETFLVPQEEDCQERLTHLSLL